MERKNCWKSKSKLGGIEDIFKDSSGSRKSAQKENFKENFKKNLKTVLDQHKIESAPARMSSCDTIAYGIPIRCDSRDFLIEARLAFVYSSENLFRE